MLEKPKLYVIDISNILHRAYHAMAKNDLSTSQGMPTGAVYGTFSILSTFILKNKPKNMLVCYDAQTGESWRKDIYPGYKANRTQVNAVSAQELIVRAMLDMMGIATCEKVGYEADDLIASAAYHYKDDYNIVVISGDKDLLRLVDDNVTVLDMMKNKEFTRADVIEKWGVKPEQISDFLALVGDAADCIPGVKGIGKKSAAELLSKHATVEDIYMQISNVKSTWKKKLLDNAEVAMMSKNLAELKGGLREVRGLDISFSPKKNEKLIRLFDKLEFDNALLKLNSVWSLYV